jgi:hypothetical protein
MIEFAPLLTLEVTHAYYGGRCSDFEFTTPSATERLLAGGHLLAKTREAKLTVLFEKTPGGGALSPIGGRTLRFGIRLRNAFFSNFSVLPFLPGEGLALYRNAGANPAQLQAPVALLLDPAHEEDAELLREGLFGLVEIAVDPGFYAAPPAFEIAFGAREETLKYYVVARNYAAGEFNQLDVTDAGFATDVRPKIDFDRLAPSAFTAGDLPATLLGGAGTRIALFRSQAPVARREKARKRIQLARNTEVIIAQLPQPGAAASAANLVIHLSK